MDATLRAKCGTSRAEQHGLIDPHRLPSSIYDIEISDSVSNPILVDSAAGSKDDSFSRPPLTSVDNQVDSALSENSVLRTVKTLGDAAHWMHQLPNRRDHDASYKRWLTSLKHRGLRRLLAPLVGLLIFCGAAAVLIHELRDLPLQEVSSYFVDLPGGLILLAVGLTVMNFLVLSGYDALALRYVEVEMSYRRVALSAFIGYAFSQAIGNPLITGGGVRYRLYSVWGLSPPQIAKTVLFAGISFWLGCFALGTVIFLGQPVSLQALDLPVSPAMIGTACLLPTAAYIGTTMIRTRPLMIRGWTLEIPDLWMVPAQVGIAATDFIVAASVLYVLLPSSVEVSYLYLLGVFQIALIGGVMSHVPGGLGVFDGILLLMLGPFLPTSAIVGAVLAFRVIFHILPLTIAACAYLLFETRQVRHQLEKRS